MVVFLVERVIAIAISPYLKLLYKKLSITTQSVYLFYGVSEIGSRTLTVEFYHFS
jgi:hypothetical protein